MTEIWSVALGALKANKLRASLTMLGIVIGIASVIGVVGLGLGAQRAVSDRLARLGTTLLEIEPQRERRGGIQWGETKRLTSADATMLNERGTHFAGVQPEQNRDLQVVHRNRNTNVRIVGTTQNYLAIRGFELEVGRMFTSGENRGRQRVAVLGSAVVEQLGYLSATTLLGETIRIAGQQFLVIGVMKPRGRAGGGGNPDAQVLVPLRTARFRLFGVDRLNSIYVLAASEAQVPAAMGEIQSILRRSHRLDFDQPDDFRVRNESDFLTAAQDTAEVFTYLLAGIAAVSLVVGGIGIMNIMLVSVTERTREIGIRKSVGATRRTILCQFLAEAVVICSLGGMFGVLAGTGALVIMREGFGMNAEVAPYAAVGALVFAAAIGILFGVWPARRAAALDPIVALRYE